MNKIKNPWIGLTDKGYNCFACAPSNPYGLKMEFYEDGDDIVSKRSRRKDEIIVRGVRILKKHIRDEFNVNSSAVESIIMKIGRKYGVKLI
jgi:hypothetical protein